jgi:DNA-binding NtrC family response regulator
MKKNNGPVCIITYLGLDGACAAAMALLKFPDARVRVTSRARVAETLARTAAESDRWEAVHLCGVGVGRDREGVAAAAQSLKGLGTDVHWHCGRGYLDPHRRWLEACCRPRFTAAGSNTAALRRHLDPPDRKRAAFLGRLARHDPNLGLRAVRLEPGDDNWLRLVRTAITQYFKYEDRSRYRTAIDKLARGELDEEDLRLMKMAETSGSTFVLEGRSPAIRRLRRRIGLTAASDAPVLITGESGTGKEHVAHLIHEGGGRAAEPFVPVNCALYAGNNALVNADLFGHVRGAFTGADADRPGRFEVADNGILFLDEIGELPPEVQAKLLRVLEDGRVERVGASGKTRTVNVRLIAATNRKLARLTAEGLFREDLFHRLDVLPLEIPPLRERREDIAGLAQSAWSRLKTSDKRWAGRELGRRDTEALEEYHWPGNVRQLKKLLWRALAFDQPAAEALAEERQRLAADQGAGSPDLPETTEGIEPLDRFRRRYALRALSLLDGNRAATARKLNISVNTLKAWIAGPEV